ncbi:dienelactone hydrolase [Mycena floridula]|nr:dienelactone hydrolase [Mycena floridula]
MLVTKTFRDVPLDDGLIRIFIVSPVIPDYPHATFPGIVVFSEIYQVTTSQERFASQIASQGYVVVSFPLFHEFEGPEAITYDVEGTTRANRYKTEKKLAAYDQDATVAIDVLEKLSNCNGHIGVTGFCLGGHLALRAAFDSRVLSSVCLFATDLHSSSLGKGKKDEDTLRRIKSGDLNGKGEVMMIFGKDDTPGNGRDLIRKTIQDANIKASFLELPYISGDQSKGVWETSMTSSLFGLMMELFERTIARDLGPKAYE